MKFTHGFIHQRFVYFLEVSGSRVDQAGGGHVVDLAGRAAGVVMDEVFGLGVEDFGISPGQADAVVDIGAGLLF